MTQKLWGFGQVAYVRLSHMGLGEVGGTVREERGSSSEALWTPWWLCWVTSL